MEDFENLREVMTESEEIFDGEVVHLFKDTVELPNGKKATREAIRHIGAVAVVPVTEEGNVIIERQFRLAAAKRELEEETGYTADEWTELGTYCPAAAYCDEVITIYLARGLHKGTRKLDEDEFLNIREVPLEELVKDIMQGKIADGKTQVGLLKAYCREKFPG